MSTQRCRPRYMYCQRPTCTRFSVFSETARLHSKKTFQFTTSLQALALKYSFRNLLLPATYNSNKSRNFPAKTCSRRNSAQIHLDQVIPTRYLPPTLPLQIFPSNQTIHLPSPRNHDSHDVVRISMGKDRSGLLRPGRAPPRDHVRRSRSPGINYSAGA